MLSVSQLLLKISMHDLQSANGLCLGHLGFRSLQWHFIWLLCQVIIQRIPVALQYKGGKYSMLGSFCRDLLVLLDTRPVL